MSLEYKVVDAFTSKPFQGNPAAVIILSRDHGHPDEVLQAIAREFNLSETAYVTPMDGNGLEGSPLFGLRWFTPSREAILCGHATLASASVLFKSDAISKSTNLISFSTLSGILTARRVPATEQIELDFPAGEVVVADQLKSGAIKQAVIKATALDQSKIIHIGLGSPEHSYHQYVLVELDSSVNIQKLEVNSSYFVPLTPLDIIILTNQSKIPGIAYDLRVFAPNAGIDEDPVCGSANTFIAAYWSQKLGYQQGDVLAAKQPSLRGGDLWVVWQKDRVKLRGEARLVAEGKLFVEGN